MSRDLCLLSADDTPVRRAELIEMFAQKQRRVYVNAGDTNGDVKSGDTIYSWAAEDLSQPILKVLEEDNLEALEELSDNGVLIACTLALSPHSSIKATESQLKELAAELGEEHAECVRNGKVQYEASGLLGGWEDESMRLMLQLQYETVQIIAFLRGGLLMDSGSLKELVVQKGQWAPTDFAT
jgi:hypothetical protein